MGVQILLVLVIMLTGIAIGFYAVSIFNSLVRLKNDIDKAWANIDVLLKERHDELPKLIDTHPAIPGHEHGGDDEPAEEGLFQSERRRPERRPGEIRLRAAWLPEIIC